MNLVTGGTGFLGAYIVAELLSKGEQVKAVRRSTSSMSQFNYITDLMLAERAEELRNKVVWVEGDILDYYSIEDALQGCNKCYHAAALVAFEKKHRNKLLTINTEGTANVVNACLYKQVRLCHVSSVAAIGRKKSGEVIDETADWVTSRYNTNYAQSKYAAEMEVWRGIEEGLDAVIINPSLIIGPGDWDNGTPKLFRNVYNGWKFYTEGVNGMVDVRDVAKASVALMNSGISNERYIAAGNNVSFKDFFFKVADALNKPRPTIEVTKTIGEIAWRVFEAIAFITRSEPKVTKENARSAQNKWFYNNSKIKDAIGINFIPIEDTIAFTAKELLKQKTTE